MSRPAVLLHRVAGLLFVIVFLLTGAGAFFLEPAPDKVKRPFVLSGLVLAALGTALFTIAAGRQPAETPR